MDNKDYFTGRIFANRCNKQKLITVPTRCNFKKGDYVIVRKIKEDEI